MGQWPKPCCITLPCGFALFRAIVDRVWTKPQTAAWAPVAVLVLVACRPAEDPGSALIGPNASIVGNAVVAAKAQTAPTRARHVVVVSPTPGRINAVAAVTARLSAADQIVYRYQHIFSGFMAYLTPAEVAQLRQDTTVSSVLADPLLAAGDPPTSSASRRSADPLPWGLDRINQRDRLLHRSAPTPSYAADYVGVHPVRYFQFDSGIEANGLGRSFVTFDAIAIATRNAEEEEGNDLANVTSCPDHGTRTASIAVDATYGVASEFPGRVYDVRVLGCMGADTKTWTTAGIVTIGVDLMMDEIAENEEVDTSPVVANFSLKVPATNDQIMTSETYRLRSTLEMALEEGIVIVAGAGNENDMKCDLLPAKLEDVITVGASNLSDGRRSSSNTCHVDLFAPGEDVPTTNGSFSGTSAAAPHVAGTAILYLSQHPQDAGGVAEVLLTNASRYKLRGIRAAPNRLLYVGFLDGDGHPQADFSHECTGLSCTFYGAASSGPASSDDHGVAEYTWTVGDSVIGPGMADTLRYSFAAADTYTVELTVADTVGMTDPNVPRQTDTRIQRIQVTGTPPPPPVDSLPAPSFTSSCGAAYTCEFASTSTDDRGIERFAWTISDSTVSDSVRFTHEFERAGTVSVKLRVTDTGMQSDSVTRSVVVPPDSMPTASYALTCTGLACTLDGSDSYDDHGVVNYTWYVWGDSVASSAQSSVLHTFPRLGQYYVSLRVKDGAEQTAWSSGTVYVGDPVATFSLSGECESSHWCTFSASGSAAPRGVARYVWHVDGDSIGYVPHPYQSYGIQFDGVGEYRVRLTVVESTSGRTADTTRVLHITSDSSWLADEVPTDAAPMAAFTSSCTGRSCTFDGSGSSDDVGVETYAWSVTSGATSVATGTSSTLAHRFASDTTYAVRLVVTDSASQADTVSRNVAVGDLPPVAAFTVACDSLACVFDGSTSTDDLGIAQYAWTVDGDSVGTVTEGTLAYTFDRAGTYGVRLRVSDTAVPAQTSDSTLSVTVPRDEPPEAAYTASCTGRACTFDGSGSTDDVGIETYAWAVDGDSAGTGSSATLSHRFASDTTYAVRLIVTDSASQADTLSRNVIVEDLPPAAGFTVRCDSLACVFDGSTSTDDLGEIAKYAWTVDGDSVGTVTADTLAHTFDGAGTYSVRLQVSDTAVPAQTSDSTRQVLVGSAQPTRPDLEVGAPSVSDATPETGAAFTLSATVSNAGGGPSAATTLRYYLSEDATISASDTPQGTDAVGALAAGGTSAESISVTAPSTSGTYYYGACVDAVSGESDTTDNCSASVQVDVEAPPNLQVGAPSVSDTTPETGAAFTLSATVTNAGDGASAATTLRYYLSEDATISASDTPQGTDAVGALAAGGTSAESISVTAPSTSGRYYYGACVDAVSGESDTTDNCSASVQVDVEPPPTYPNLEVGTPSVSDRAPVTGAAFTLSATVTNAGDGSSASTTLRYFRSTDATIGTSDTAAGTDAVVGLAAGGTSAESISVTAPSTSGTYYYGACVGAVAGESDTTDNCSASVRVDVEPRPMHPNLEVGTPSVSDRAPETDAAFTLSATVTNAGGGSSAETTLRYFRSADATISASDTPQGTDAVGALAAGGTSAESISVTAPPAAGRYYYGACVDAVAGESDTTDNCSASVRVDVEPPPTYPNLEVGTPSVSDRAPETSAAFTLSATVTNAGDESSAATTLRYFRSTDATISASDTPQGTDAVVGLTAGGASAESISVTAPSTSGRYYYGACVDVVAGESDTMDNCSASVRVDVEDPPKPNLQVGAPSVSDRVPVTGAAFTLSATVTNAGDGSSGSTTLRYFRSTDATIGTSDTAAGTDAVGGLAAGGTSAESISLTAPSTAGRYYYGACVDAVTGESNTADNCSASVQVDVEAPPNLQVGAPSVSDRAPVTGAAFTLSATVTNAGDGASGSTTLRYFRSTDATIGTSDTAAGTDAVVGLAAGGTSAESISVTAPSTSGTYYYGACVDAVAGESDTRDNCSTSVRVDVDGPPTAILDVTCTGRDCTFDGSASTDDGRITGYAWAVDGVPVGSGTASSRNHTFPSNGTYTVTLTVEDSADPAQTDTDSQTVTVRDDPPVASFTTSCNANRACTFDGSGSTDDVGIENYTWSVLEGVRSTATATGSTFKRTFGYGTWYVTLSVADRVGQTGHAADTLVFNEPDDPPEASLSVSCEDLECTFNGSGSSDDNRVVSYAFAVDGTQVATGTSSSVDHTFGRGGTYSVTLTVADSIGQTGVDTASVTVVPDNPPTAILSVTCSGRECTLDGSNSADDKGITDYAWAVDGTEVASGDSTSVEHAFASNGTYEVVLTVTDTKGQTGSATESVTVRDNPPTASFTYSCKGLTCTFDASGSSDDIGIAGYTWSFLEDRAPPTPPPLAPTRSPRPAAGRSPSTYGNYILGLTAGWYHARFMYRK